MAPLAIAAAVWATTHAAPLTGRIEGAVRLTMPQRAALSSGAYAPRLVTRPAPHPSTVSDVVVFIRDLATEGVLPVTRETMVQRDESFEPRVLAIARGSTVDFPNADPYFHNVFSLSSGAAFDLGRYKRGDSRARKLRRPKITVPAPTRPLRSLSMMGVRCNQLASACTKRGTRPPSTA